MKTNDLRNLTTAELGAQLTEAQKAYAVLERSVMGGQEKNHSKLRNQRRMIARLKTIQRQNYGKQ